MSCRFAFWSGYVRLEGDCLGGIGDGGLAHEMAQGGSRVEVDVGGSAMEGAVMQGDAIGGVVEVGGERIPVDVAGCG